MPTVMGIMPVAKMDVLLIGTQDLPSICPSGNLICRSEEPGFGDRAGDLSSCC